MSSRKEESVYLLNELIYLFLSLFHLGLVFLIRIVKNVFFGTIELPANWTSNNSKTEELIKHFQNAGNPHTYVLLFQDETVVKNTESFLQLVCILFTIN